jgi:hypothetical protein
MPVIEHLEAALALADETQDVEGGLQDRTGAGPDAGDGAARKFGCVAEVMRNPEAKSTLVTWGKERAHDATILF